MDVCRYTRPITFGAMLLFKNNINYKFALKEGVMLGGFYSTLYHTLVFIPRSRDLTERNIHSRSNQTDKVTKQWEMYEGPRHHAEQ